MNLLTLTTFIAVEALFLAFIILVVRSGVKNHTNQSFLVFLIAFALWGAANFVSNLTFLASHDLLLLNRGLFAVSILGLVSLLVFIGRVTRQRVASASFIILSILAVAGVVVSFVPQTVENVFVDQDGVVGVNFGMLATFYFLVVAYVSIMIVYRLVRGVRQKLAIERSRARVLLVSIGLAITAILLTNVLIPVVTNNFSLTMLGVFAGMFIIAGVSYGIIRHGMFDIKRAAVRSVTYSLVLVTLAGLYFLLAFVLSGIFGSNVDSTEQVVGGVGISLVLAFVFQPVKRFFDQVTNKIFYRNEYSSEDFFAALNKTLVSTTDLKKLLLRISSLIAQNLKSEQVFFALNASDGRHVTAGTSRHTKLPAADARELAVYMTGYTSIIQAATTEDQSMRRLLHSHRIELVMALRRDAHVIGFLCLGEHLSATYTHRDLRVLRTISDELVIAIQNALSLQEIKDLNASLEQRIDAATKELRASNAQLQRLDAAKDEFISMASHQLRTPLTSIKGHISMIMEGDVGKVSPDQKHLLREAFISSERMVRLIGDFLNVSRLQTGKFVIEKRPVDLAKLVARELDALEPNASARGLSFVYKRPKNFPLLNLDENKFQQVVMNFADNAIYYSKDNATITVALKATKDDVEFTIKDTGIGVPAAQQDRLFTKFFRATNARQQRPDGTGVGLFLAKKVIDAHQGEIIFASKENRGSTFGFRLPVASLLVTDDTNQLEDQPAKH